ncbi:unnamed protein product [Pneumocystis jirovecii]|uniref:Uncharacterized protein n=1 Tax=Pneumocystis jirovecii TaxID=42068 RepID=L0PGP2_PNEJI|nr:unnamed protein product [Pneumocystis jirovecii]CCJ31463.1 unnamed protein product [Pneumocystis jirovecii]
MRTRSRSTVRPLWPPPSPARFATWSHYRLRDHGDHTRPVDPLRRTHRGRHHRRHRCGCWRLYRRHHRWGRSGSPLRAHERLFRRGYGGRPRGRGTVGRHLLACTIPCGGGAQRPQPTTGLLPNAGVA